MDYKKQDLENKYIARPILSGQVAAIAKVSSAICKGIIPRPSTLLCDDCGLPASQYDHRDYNFPLLVAPVCRKCNINRGQAIPINGFFEKMIKLGHPPYEYRIHMKRLAEMFGYVIENIDQLPYRVTIEHWIDFWPLNGIDASQNINILGKSHTS